MRSSLQSERIPEDHLASLIFRERDLARPEVRGDAFEVRFGWDFESRCDLEHTVRGEFCVNAGCLFVCCDILCDVTFT
jgi:hypothetical protein